MRRSLSLGVVLCLVAVPATASSGWTDLWDVSIARDVHAEDLVADADGTLYWAARVLGISKFGSVLRRYSSDGRLLDRETVPGVWVDALSLSPDGANLAVAGRSDGGVPWLAWYAADGLRRTWTLQMTDVLDEWDLGWITAVGVAPDGNSIYVAGTRSVELFFGTEVYEIFVARLSVQGDVLWVRGVASDSWAARTLLPRADGKGVVVGGSSLADPSVESDDYRALLVAFDETGTMQWSHVSSDDIGDAWIDALALSANGRRLFAVGQGRAADAAGRGEWYFQQFASDSGAALERRRLGLMGRSGVAHKMVRRGKALYVAGSGCSEASPHCSPHLMTLDKRGIRKDLIANGSARRDLVGGLALGPRGHLYWTGGANRSAWIRKMSSGPVGRRGATVRPARR